MNPPGAKTIRKLDLDAGAERLRNEMLNRGLSMNSLSNVAGLSDGVLSRALDGKNIHPGSRKKIADALDLTILDIWPLVEETRAAA